MDLQQKISSSDTIIMTGHSLGAGIASVVGSLQNLEVAAFSGPGIEVPVLHHVWGCLLCWVMRNCVLCWVPSNVALVFLSCAPAPTSGLTVNCLSPTGFPSSPPSHFAGDPRKVWSPRGQAAQPSRQPVRHQRSCPPHWNAHWIDLTGSRHSPSCSPLSPSPSCPSRTYLLTLFFLTTYCHSSCATTAILSPVT